MSRVIRIGTRESQLALWQADKVKTRLESSGYSCELVLIKSKGDLVLDKPLYELGVTGIFTRALDVALLQEEIDIAVHSMKDVPTLLPEGIVQTAVLPRGATSDVLITKGNTDLSHPSTIATGSLRRKAQWLNKYPHHQVVNLRGNVNTRLKKLDENPWQGAIFAKAGLERIDLLPDSYLELDWMIPAPAQGAMMVVSRKIDSFSTEATSILHDEATGACTGIEREFLRTLEGGCTAPIGAIAEINDGKVSFKGVLLNIDGTKNVYIEKQFELSNSAGKGKEIAIELLERGGHEIMNELKQDS